MMRRVINFLLLLTFIGAFSCKKDDTSEPTPTPAPAENKISNFFEQNRAENTQTFFILAQEANFLLGEKGTQIQIGPNSFADKDGNLVGGGIRLNVLEVFDKADMILNDMPTVTADGQLLESGGEWIVSAEQGGNELQLSNEASFHLFVPTEDGVTPPDQNMLRWTGEWDDDGQLSWGEPDSAVTFQQSDSILHTAAGINARLDVLGAMNLDAYYHSSDPTTPVELLVPDGHNLDNTRVWIAFTDDDVLGRVFAYEDGRFSFGPWGIPIGSNVTFLALAEIEDELFMASKTTTIVDGHTETFTFNPTTVEAFKAYANSL